MWVVNWKKKSCFPLYINDCLILVICPPAVVEVICKGYRTSRPGNICNNSIIVIGSTNESLGGTSGETSMCNLCTGVSYGGYFKPPDTNNLTSCDDLEYSLNNCINDYKMPEKYISIIILISGIPYKSLYNSISIVGRSSACCYSISTTTLVLVSVILIPPSCWPWF